MSEFEERNAKAIREMKTDSTLAKLTQDWFTHSAKHEYSYHFLWMGRPIIQYPQDIIAMQELIWTIKPSLIIETGIAHGGLLILYASLLELIGGAGRVVGIDIDIRPHNRVEIEKHPMFKRITMLEGSSIDEKIAEQVRRLADGQRPILVVLDSNHTHSHVAEELRLYSPLVTKGSFLVVFDTVVENMSKAHFSNRPWGPGDNPMTAVREFLGKSDRFEVDPEIEHKLQITVAPGGYLRCIKD